MPRGGSLEDQEESFADVLPFFVEHWRTRHYQSIWRDVSQFAESVLTSVFGKK